MKHEKNKPYDELDRRLKAYTDNSMNAIPIDETAKNRIWKNLNHEIHEQTMRRQYRVRRTYRLAFVISIVLVLIVSLDISSKASLFKRLLTTVSDGTLQFHSRDVDNSAVRDEELLDKINDINEEQGTEYRCPISIGTYKVNRFDNNENALLMDLIDSNNNKMEIVQRYYVDGGNSIGTNVTYNNDFFEGETMNLNGIEYHIFKSEVFTIGLYTIGSIEVQVKGSDYNEVLEVIRNLEE